MYEKKKYKTKNIYTPENIQKHRYIAVACWQFIWGLR